MKVYDFVKKQNDLKITNTVLNDNTKINETLLDLVYYSLDTLRTKTDNTCNVIIKNIPNENAINIQMSGNSQQSTSTCYQNLQYYVNENLKKYQGSKITKESDSYKISIEPKSTNTTTNTNSSTENNSVNSGYNEYELEQEVNKLVYGYKQPKVNDVQKNDKLTTEIKRIKKMML